MRLALAEAQKGKTKGHRPYGTVVVDAQGNLLAKAHNTVHKDFDVSSHAEIAAIRRASRKLANHKLERCSLYATAEPCLMCMGAAVWARIEHVYFGISIGELEKLGYEQITITDKQIANKAPWKIVVTGGVLAADCHKLYAK